MTPTGPTRVPPRGDMLLALLVAGFSVLEVVLNTAVAPKPGALAGELVIALGIAFRRSSPLLACVVVAIGGIGMAAVGVPLNEPVVPLLGFVIVAYSVASFGPVMHAVAGLGMLVGSLAVESVIDDGQIGNVVFGLVFLSAFGLMGATVRRRTAEAAALSRAAALREHELAEEARRATEEERARIAREIHDVVAHSLSVMIVQSGAAEQVLRDDPGRALEPLQAVQSTGRAALAEMSALLGVLRNDHEEMGLAPQPGIDRLPSLLAEARTAGLPVELEVCGSERVLPVGIGLTVYRVVQEALTNTRKHSGPVPVRVEVRYLPDSVDVAVLDSGDGRARGHQGGHGLVGMRERVAMYDGSLAAGPEAGGGYSVRVSIPLPEPA